jgi:hypothetical protein
MSDIIFADGIIAKRSDNAPEYVLVNLSIKVDEAVAFLQQHQSNGWVNLQVKRSKQGKIYAALDTWKPTQGDSAVQGIAHARQAAAPSLEPFEDKDLPF